ncbi:MAG: PAS domain S-box protein [Desulfitobacterium hafniense]|nr:PAS domain S-box protein [Desulfitobacterium hafniense]
MDSNSKIKLDQVFQAVNAGIIVIDDLGAIYYCNPVAANFIGLDVRDIMGKPIMEVIANLKLSSVVQDGGNYSDQLLIGEQTVITNSSPINQDGKTMGAVAVFQDGSELQSLLSCLDNTQNSLDGLESIFEQAYDGVIVVDCKGR